MTTDTGRGHPRHQLRQFTVTVRHRNERPRPVQVTAQTERDAILRAGMTLARQGGFTNTLEFTVTGVQDPAPFTWTPVDEEITS